MANLKDLKTRINSVKSTQKITSAMKMVAAAKLRRAQESAEANRPYSSRMQLVISGLASKAISATAPELLIGREIVKTHLLIVVSADKGLCGGFNGSIARQTRFEIKRLEEDGKSVLLYMIGKKAADNLGREIRNKIFGRVENLQGSNLDYNKVDTVSQEILTGFNDTRFDRVSIIYNQFVNAITQNVVAKSLIPAQFSEDKEDIGASNYEYEPDENELLARLLPRNITTQIYSALLESFAAELAARMTAMDNATRNAGDMIDSLTLVYNRTRQANITKELIEIISGAEAL